jgi:hypothetical protein
MPKISLDLRALTRITLCSPCWKKTPEGEVCPKTEKILDFQKKIPCEEWIERVVPRRSISS